MTTRIEFPIELNSFSLQVGLLISRKQSRRHHGWAW